MGEGTTRLNGGGSDPTPRELGAEIDEIRDELDDLVGELDRRRHELLDWRIQLRRHRRGLTLAAGATVALIVGARAWRRRRERPLAHAQNLLHALELVAREPEALERAVESQRLHPARAAAGIVGSAMGPFLRAGAARLLRNP